MANNIQLIEKYATEAWDKVYKAEAISSMLDAPNELVRFDTSFKGAKTVKIARWTSGGLSDYYRANNRVSVGDNEVNNIEPNRPGYITEDTGALDFGVHVDGDGAGYGYQTSSMQLVWDTFTMQVDRAAKFQVESMDDEETDGLAMGATTTEISRTVIIPEVDAYCFAKVASYTDAGLGNRVDAEFGKKDDKYLILEALNAAYLWFDEHEVPAENQIIFISAATLNALRTSPEFVRYLGQADMDKDVDFKVMTYEGRKMVMVPPQRFNTGIYLYNGGYRLTGKPIDFLVVSKGAVSHVVKYNKTKVIDKDLNLASQNFDGYTIFARIYHDVFVAKNKRVALYCHTGGFGDTLSALSKGENEIILETTSAGKIKDIGIYPAHLFVKFYKGEATVGTKLNALPEANTAVKVGDTLTSGDNVYAIDSKLNVVAVKEYTTE